MKQYLYLLFSLTALALVGSKSALAQFVQFNPGTNAQVDTNGFDSALVLSGLTLYPGSSFDLTNGGMVVDASNFNYYAPNGSGGYVLETGTVAINDAIANEWGTYIQGTGAQGDETGGLYTSANVNGYASYLGWIQNSVTQYTDWRGVDLTQSAVESMTDPVLIGDTYPGDLYLRGVPADANEFATITSNFQSGKTNTTWSDGDIYYEGSVNQYDLSTILAAEGQPALYYVDGMQFPSVPVPEPASLSLLLAATAFCGLGVWLKARIGKSLRTASAE